MKELAAYLSANALDDDIVQRIGADLDQRERERSAAAEALMASIAAKAESVPAFHGAPLRRGFRDRTARYMARVHGARTPDEAH